ncbi:hypothetical protein chiPu_0028226, partial [Chiloscyllium punctatum]|nr:hypothetical protein [Chiloscyllium punctatum]
VKLSILLVTLVVAIGSYLWMERKLARRVPFRVPRIPKPQHKVKGYRYLEDDNSDQSDEEAERQSHATEPDGDQEPVGAGVCQPGDPDLAEQRD